MWRRTRPTAPPPSMAARRGILAMLSARSFASFAWIKTIAGLHKTKHRGVGRVAFSRDQQVMGLLLADAGSAQLMGFDDRTMMSEGGAKDCEAQVHWYGDQLRR